MDKVNGRMHGGRFSTIQHELQLPHDIHVEILSWLPARSLLRFRAACHAWNAAGGDPDFALLHLARQACRQRRCRLIVEYSSRHHADRLSLRLVERGCTVESEIGFIKLEGHYPHVVGSCNGLLCLLNRGLDRDALYVCNPLLDQVLSRLPPLISSHRCYERTSYGFGFVPARHEFKVARLVTTSEPAQRLTFLEVCTLPLRPGGRWSWRTVATQLPYHQDHSFWHPTFHAFVNGKLHWLAAEDDGDELAEYRNYVMFSFDLAEERIEVVPCVEGITRQLQLTDTTVTEINGCLSTIANICWDSRLEVWVMKEYGKVESWTRILSLQTRCLRDFMSSIWIPHVSVISDCAILIGNNENSIAYNIATHQISQRFSCDIQVLDHVPSLISLKPRRADGR